MSIYDYKVKKINGDEISLSEFKGNVLLIVNTASKCGFTPQYEGLQKLYDTYRDKGLVILGFPSNQFGSQEPGENSEVSEFCKINYGVSFPLFEKIDVRDSSAHELFQFLTEAAPFKGFDLNNPNAESLHGYLKKKYPDFLEGNSIKWNFTKFLIDKEGGVFNRYESPTAPESLVPDIEKLL